VTWLPAAALAQSGTIAGVVRDTTGAVLPGVTVEASSPALIEKVRTAVTDDQGQYKVVDLRPGTYTVSFMLTGFNTFKRDGIELSTGFTATVNADLRVGSLEETITVSGQAPLVDVQNVRQQTVMNREVIDSIPVARQAQSYAVLVPGVIATGQSSISSQDVGGTNGDRNPTLRIHGSRTAEMPLLYDGMRFNNMNATPGGGHHLWAANTGAVEEYTIEVGAQSAEAEAAGVRTNIIPRQGGNVFRGYFYGNYTNDSLQSTSNVEDQTKIFVYPKIWDFNPAIGGPIRQDKLWFFASYRYQGTHERPTGAYYDRDSSDFVYQPDLSRPAVTEIWSHGEELRLTWQATPKNKISIWGNTMQRCWCGWQLSATTTPDASRILKTYPNVMSQVTWNAPLTNKLLIDAGWTYHPESWGGWPQDHVPYGTAGMTELSTGVIFRGGPFYYQHRTRQTNGKVYLSYVTGSHAFRFGFQDMWGHRTISNWTLGVPYSLNLLNGVPASLSQYTYPYNLKSNLKYYMGLFAQDQWTIDRFTLNLGVRFDAMHAYIEEQHHAATQLVGERTFPEIEDVPRWKDINPRFGLAYDLFGNGKTALKMAVGRYVQAVTTAYADNLNPLVTSVNSANRTWADINGNFTPDCDLQSVTANAECGALSNVNFGRNVPTTTWDRDFLVGWGKRPFDWEIQGGIQHELMPGVSVHGTYTRHWWDNFPVIDNLAVSPSDYSSFCVTAPVDPRLPGGGGNQICGFMDVNPNKFGQVDNFVTFADNYGAMRNYYQGVDLSVNVRLPRGILVQGGTSTGREVWDNCDIVGKIDNPGAGPIDLPKFGIGTPPAINNINNVSSPSTLYCHFAPPVQTQVKLLGAVPLPWDVSASATLQSIPGPMINATYNVTSAQVAPSLGRNLAAGANATTRVELIEPGTVFGERMNQIDARVAKTFRMGARRIQAQFDIYNLLNVGPSIRPNTNYGAAFLDPIVFLPGRMLKFGVQMDF
jgi:hypothetical protein